jgi:hypothetical protein
MANLLFHPDLIPRRLRFEARDHALNSDDVPYSFCRQPLAFMASPWDEVRTDNRAASPHQEC